MIFKEAQEIVPILHPEAATSRSSIIKLLIKTKQISQENTLRTPKVMKFLRTLFLQVRSERLLLPIFLLPSFGHSFLLKCPKEGE